MMVEPEGLFEPVLVSDSVARMTSSAAWVQKMVEVEGVIAKVQAEMGLIPMSAADEIALLSTNHDLDPGELGRLARGGGTPVIPLVRLLTDKLSESARPWIHYGATSQDILDTATMLVLKDAFDGIFHDALRVGSALAELADLHRETLMVSRTLLQHALPYTFGLKAAIWMSGITGACSELMHVYLNELAIQFGGAGGTLAALGDNGSAVSARVAESLGLSDPKIPWHAQRGRVAKIGASLTLFAGALAKIAGDIALGSQAEIGEFSESMDTGGGSSAMPQKVNPVGPIVVNASFRRCQGLLPVLFGCLLVENERGAGEWQAEWETLRDLVRLTGGSAHRMAVTLENLSINATKMAENLDLTRGNVMSERILLKLTEQLGRTVAHELVREATLRSTAESSTLADELIKEEVFREKFTAHEIEELFDPATYLGSAQSIIDTAIAQWKELEVQMSAIASREEMGM